MNRFPTAPRPSRPHAGLPVLSALAIALGCAGPAWAIDGGNIAAGTGTLQTQRNVTTVNQSSDRMVVNWKNFDIARNQTVNFQQPGASAAVLNRVSGSGKATEILGSIKANGRVFVVNPDGVMFGRTAKVDAGALVASALDTNAQEFMAGGRAYGGNVRPGATDLPRYVGFDGGNGAVVNEGRLTAREAVVLIGPQASNAGTIRARSVEMHAGDGVAVRLDGSSFDIVPTRGRADALVENSGAIVAAGGNIMLSAATKGDLLRDVVRNTGTLEASRAVSGSDGNIELQAPIDGAISIGGQVRAEGGVKANTTPLIYLGDAPMPTLEYPAALAATGHDIRIEQGARVKATNAVSLSTENDIAVNGRIVGGSVWLYGDDVTTQGTIHGASNVNVDARGSLVQKGDIVADTAHVSLRAHDIDQASGVVTRAGDYVSLEAAHEYGGRVRAAKVQGKYVNITGHDIQLDGNVRAAANIRVTAVDERVCDEVCTAEVRQGSIVQNAGVISDSGDVTFTGYSTVKWPTAISRATTGTLTQNAGATTRAAGNVTVDVARASIGNIQAGKSIVVKSKDTTLTGRLVAPEITLPSNARNTEGNVRIKR